MKTIFKNSIFFIITLVLFSCKKFVEIPPSVSQISKETVFSNNATATSAASAIYASLSTRFTGGEQGLSVRTGLSADEISLVNLNRNDLMSYYRNNLSSSDATFWIDLYENVYSVNALIEGLTVSKGVTEPVRKQLMAEGFFMRGFLYFYLVNLYGDIPLMLSTDYRENSVMARTPISEIYSQIVSDLTEAEKMLNENYVGADALSTTNQKVRPCKALASAFLAKVYLYLGNWSKSEECATKVINDLRYQLTDLNKIFLANSNEAIWQLQGVLNNVNTLDGLFYISTDGYPVVSLSKIQLNAFEANDLRKSAWIGTYVYEGKTYYYPYKYKVKYSDDNLEYLTIMRLAELYLIRSEARIQQDNIIGGTSDLNKLRQRASSSDSGLTLPLVSSDVNKTQALLAIERERHVELFTEFGDRWFNLKRTHRINDLMPIANEEKGSSWTSYKQLYPILFDDIQKNHKLIQNPGYN